MRRYGIPSNHIFSSRTTEFSDDTNKLTGSLGVNVVLNSLAGPFLQASLDVLSLFGRFVEIGKSDALASSRMGMHVFQRCISISSVDLVNLSRHKPDDAADLYSNVYMRWCKNASSYLQVRSKSIRCLKSRMPCASSRTAFLGKQSLLMGRMTKSRYDICDNKARCPHGNLN